MLLRWLENANPCSKRTLKTTVATQLQKVSSKVQVSLAIRGGYVPDKFQTANTKTGSLGPKLG